MLHLFHRQVTPDSDDFCTEKVKIKWNEKNTVELQWLEH